MDEAYRAMMSNPDAESRKDCLRQFVVILCERQQLQALVQFPYMNIYDDVRTLHLSPVALVASVNLDNSRGIFSSQSLTH